MKKTTRGRAIIIMALALGLASCFNPYKHLGDRPPLSAKDTAALLARCIKITPLDTAEISEPTLNMPDLPADSSEFYSKLRDSLDALKLSALERIKLKYKDTCLAAAQDNYNDGFRDGEQYGIGKGAGTAAENNRKALSRADSIARRNCSDEINKLKQAYNLRLTAADNRMGIAEAKADKYQLRSDSRGRWLIGLIIACALLLILCILLWKFRRQAKAANSVINNVEDTAASVKKLI